MTDQVTESGQGGTENGDGGEKLYGGQFKSVEELEAAYAAATKPADPPKADDLAVKKTEGEGTGEGEGATDGEVANALKAAGLDQAKYTEEFATTGDLSEASLAELEKAGFPREMTSVYLEGLKAQRNAYTTAIFSEAGGESGYKAMIAWAGANLSDGEIEAFNKAIQSGDAASAKLAVGGLAAKHRASARPSLLHGKSGAGTDSVQPFANATERRQAVNDPRYRHDAAYRKSVQARIAVSEV